MASIWEEIAESLISPKSSPIFGTQPEKIAPSEDALFQGLKAVSLAYRNWRPPSSIEEWREMVALWKSELGGMTDTTFNDALQWHLKNSEWPPSPAHIRVAWDEMQKDAVYQSRFRARRQHGISPEEAQRLQLSAEKRAYYRAEMKKTIREGGKMREADRAEQVRKYGPPELRRKHEERTQ